MMRARLYLPRETYAKLTHLASVRKEPLAQVVRGYIEEGIARDRQTLIGKAHSLRRLAEPSEKEGWRSTGAGDCFCQYKRGPFDRLKGSHFA